MSALHANTSDHYIFFKSTNLKKDLINKAETLLAKAKNQTSSGYYVIEAEDPNEALSVYLNLVPQVSIEVKEHTEKDLNVVLGFHAYDTRGNTAYYKYGNEYCVLWIEVNCIPFHFRYLQPS